LKKRLWAFFFLLALAPSTHAARVAVLPASGVAGETEAYRLLVSGGDFPERGKIVLEFPAGFDLRPLRSVKARARDDERGLFKTGRFKVSGTTLELEFQNRLPGTAHMVLFELERVQNPARAADYRPSIRLFDQANEGAATFLPVEVFTIVSDRPIQLAIGPTPSVLKAGESVELNVAAADRFGNSIGEVSVGWKIDPGSTGGGRLVGSRFFATRSGTVELIAEKRGIAPVSTMFQVGFGALDHFEIAGSPESTVAGVPFPEPAGNVTVVAKDQFGNTVTGFTDVVTFSSDDPQAALPASYRFTAGDAGRHAFPGSSFVLKTAGNKKITVSSAGKTGSSPVVLVRSNIIADFLLLAPPEVLAGKPFNASVVGAVDLYGNPASGTATVSAASGGGVSPDGTAPTFTPIVVVGGVGQSPQTLFASLRTVLRGAAGTVSRNSDPIQVRAAALETFSLSLPPDTLSAGDTVATFSVSAKDLFGNLKSDFSGPAFFAASDGRAVLQFSVSNPFPFTGSDSGRHTFGGGAVRFLTKGTQTLTFGTGSVRSAPVPFLILPGPPAAFAVSAPASVTAGNSFNVSVQNAVDAFGNSVALSVQVGLKNSSGVSPSGDSPFLPAISVVDGTGQGSAVLPKAEKAVLEGVSGSLRFASDTVLVKPSALERFDFVLTSPQTSGVPFTQPAHLFARDRFGNLKTDFDPSADSVVLSSSPPGTWENNVLKRNSDFTSGTADLNALGATFFGPANTYTFTAASQTGKTGSTQPIEVRSVLVDSFALSPKNLIRGERFSLAFRVTNQSPGPFVLDEVKLLAAGRTLFLSFPSLPDTFAVSEKRSYGSSAAMPADFPLGRFPVQLELAGRFGPAFTTIKTPVLDFLAVADSLFLRPVAGSLNFEKVSKGRPYSFSVRLVNQSSFDVVLDSVSRLGFTNGVFSRFFKISGTMLAAQNAESRISFQPDSFPSIFPSASFSAALVLSGRRDGLSVSDSFSLLDSVDLQNRSQVFYLPGSLSPIKALLKSPLFLQVEIENGGEAAFEPDSASKLLLIHVQDTLTGHPGGPGFVAASPASRLSFQIDDIPTEFSGGFWKPWLFLSGEENGLPVSFNLAVPDSIQLFFQPRLALDTIWTATPSPQRVNGDQPFLVRFRLANPSAESLLSIRVVLREGNRPLDSLDVTFLSPEQKVSLALTVPADPDRLGLATYRLDVRPGRGQATGVDAELSAPQDRITVLRQRRAFLELRPEVVSPPTAGGGTLLAGQALTLAFNLFNLGEAPVGPGRLRLRVSPPLLNFISDSIASITSTQPAVFQLLAPDTTDSVRVTADWLALPLDSNSASPAALVSNSATLSFKIREALAGLEVSVRESSSPLIFSGPAQSLFSIAFKNVDFSNLHISILRGISIGLSGAEPADVFAEATLLAPGGQFPAVLGKGAFLFNFSVPLLLSAGESQNFSLSLKLKNPAAGPLRFFITSDLISALDSVPGAPAVPALLLREGGRPFAYTSPAFNTSAGSGLAATLVTYPNPFSPPAERMQIAYRLSAASEVELKIYTLTGELVAERTYRSGSAGGSPGVNQIEWDGRNDRGKEVKNGVYLAVIRSKATGEVVKQKLAVVR
jgi:hypothetical protein